jgi:AcrR family transcriptional regulator
MRQAPRTGRGGQRPGARPRRPQQRAVETRERLVAAALAVFASRGFDGATTREIARRAGVALAALPYHFETKEALWRAAADRIFGRLAERFAEPLRAARTAPGSEGPRRLLREFVRFAAEHPELHRFMLQEGTGPSARLSWLVDTHVRPLYDAVRGLAAPARRGVRGRPEHLYYAMIGAASMPYAVAPEFELLTGAKPDARGRVEAHIALLERLFFPDATETGSSRRAGEPRREGRPPAPPIAVTGGGAPRSPRRRGGSRRAGS